MPAEQAWTSEHLRSNNTQTPPKTGHRQGPEDEARHHDPQPCTVCKTSIPGSNPGGASKILKKLAELGVCRRPRAISYCSEKPSNSLLVPKSYPGKSLHRDELSACDP